MCWHQVRALFWRLSASEHWGAVCHLLGQGEWQAIRWARPLQVYESLRRASTFPNEKLSHFDQEGAEELLYEMRNLGVSLRPTTAEYIADNNLDPYVSTRSISCTAPCPTSLSGSPRRGAQGRQQGQEACSSHPAQNAHNARFTTVDHVGDSCLASP